MQNYVFKRWHAALGGAFIIVLAFYFSWIRAPKNFPVNQFITIKPGSGLYSLSLALEEEGVVRSAVLFRTTAIILGGEHRMKAGDYYMPRRENVFTIAFRIAFGVYDVETKKITIPEGFTAKMISNLFTPSDFPKFDQKLFLKNAQEGYLFPDTYFIEVIATASSTLDRLSSNFHAKFDPLKPDILKSGHSEKEILTVASILESEAKTKIDREIISGIVWKRLKLSMPLQVDATLGYITGRGSSELLASDLATSSPYNTYIHAGLPPTPISNPGLESIEAAINPTTTPYFYFLTGSDGKMHYARTFDEHKANREKYLK